MCTCSCISLTYRRNNVEPRIDPCGAPFSQNYKLKKLGDTFECHLDHLIFKIGDTQANFHKSGKVSACIHKLNKRYRGLTKTVAQLLIRKFGIPSILIQDNIFITPKNLY